MKTSKLFISFFILLVGCSESGPTNFSDLKNVNGVYYLEGKPFTGEVYRTYSGNESKVWIEGEIKNGLPTTYQEPVNIEKLNLRNNLYYLINTNTPFSGYIFSQDLRGQMELEGSFKDGMPSGTTLTYGPSGSVINTLTINDKGFLYEGQKIEYGERDYILVKDDSLFFEYKDDLLADREYQSINGVWLLGESFLNQNLVQQLELISADYTDVVTGVVNESVFTSTGEWEIIYRDESKEVLTFNDKGYQQIEYYPNGQINRKRSFVDYGNYNLEGEAVKYYQNGQLQHQGSYIKGQKDGLYQEFFEDGALKLEFRYKEGDKNGPFLVKFANGNIKEKGEYLNDNYHGDFISYHEDGQVKVQATYINGSKKNYEQFSDSGRLIEKGIDSRNYREFTYHRKLGDLSLQYKNGKPFSGKKVLELGIEDKEVFYITTYLDGLENSKEFKKFNYDVLVEQGFLKNGEKEGTWNEYFYDGTLSAVATYTNGELNGPYKAFFADGTIQAEGAYLNGEIDIENWIAFNEYGEQFELKQPKPINPIKPMYPFRAKDKNIEGTVILRCLISKFGRVTEIEVIKGIPELNSSARDAVRRAKFSPASIGEDQVPSWIVIPIKFKL